MNSNRSLNARLIDKGQGEFALEGELTFETAGKLLEATDAVLNSDENIRVDLAGVSQFDSAGLALLVHCWREIKKAKKTIAFHEAPLQLSMMAKMSGLDRILNISNSSTPVRE